MFKEKVHRALPGIPVLLLAIVMLIVPVAGILTWLIVWIVDLFYLAGFFTVQPNQGMVLTLFGRYVGAVNDSGLRFANPFYTKKPVSLRVRTAVAAAMVQNLLVVLCGEVSAQPILNAGTLHH
ncbi:MAG: hypothetical protein HY858_07185 [Candidatus Solibacter usitatus]|nr:hypothetical protein [Candidatus Solibacter usitatus]